ncbi:hypothetical protein ACFL6Y_10645 [Elusimicrobiota bacterium]
MPNITESLLTQCANTTLQNLKTRHCLGIALKEEDDIRRYFYLELLKRSINADRITVECWIPGQHPNSRVDLYVELPNTKVLAELKFHAQIPGTRLDKQAKLICADWVN